MITEASEPALEGGNMSSNEDEVYYRRRAAEHVAKAEWSRLPEVRAVHLELAARYRELIDLHAGTIAEPMDDETGGELRASS